MARCASTRPEIGIPLYFLARILPMTRFFKTSTCLMKFCLSYSVGMSDRLCSSFSSLTGRSKVKQSRSVKRLLKRRRVRFFISVFSDMPACSLKASSRYSFDVIAAPSWSTSARLKSLTSHRNDGKSLPSSSGSSNSAPRGLLARS